MRRDADSSTGTVVYKEIAAKLVITPKTVGNHVEHIYAKIDASSRAAASLFAVHNGLLPEDDAPAAP